MCVAEGPARQAGYHGTSSSDVQLLRSYGPGPSAAGQPPPAPAQVSEQRASGSGRLNAVAVRLMSACTSPNACQCMTPTHT